MDCLCKTSRFARVSQASPTSRHRVLIVEDDPVSCSALQKILQMAGFEVSCSNTIQSAMANLAGHESIILDLNLPDGDGTSVLQHLREHNPTIRIAVATASDRDAAI